MCKREEPRTSCHVNGQRHLDEFREKPVIYMNLHRSKISLYYNRSQTEASSARLHRRDNHRTIHDRKTKRRVVMGTKPTRDGIELIFGIENSALSLFVFEHTQHSVHKSCWIIRPPSNFLFSQGGYLDSVYGFFCARSISCLFFDYHHPVIFMSLLGMIVSIQQASFGGKFVYFVNLLLSVYGSTASLGWVISSLCSSRFEFKTIFQFKRIRWSKSNGVDNFESFFGGPSTNKCLRKSIMNDFHYRATVNEKRDRTIFLGTDSGLMCVRCSRSIYYFS